MKKNMRKKWVYKGIYFFATIFLGLSVVYIIKFFLVKQESVEERNLLNTVEINEQVENVTIEENAVNEVEVETEEVVQKRKGCYK